jgi:cell division protein FtsI (penicillin-binding protein 3)
MSHGTPAPAPPPGAPANRFGAPRDAAVPRMETVRVTAPDLRRRAAMEKTRGRLVFAAAGFAVLFGAVSLKLTDATVIDPKYPREMLRHRNPATGSAERAGAPIEAAPPVIRAVAMTGAGGSTGGLPRGPDAGMDDDDEIVPQAQRAMITDRNGEILAVSLPTAGVYADPREMTDPVDAAHKLKQVMPDLDEALVEKRLSDPAKRFVYLARQISPRQELAINDLGIPGISFQSSERRRYPLGRVAAQVLGGTDVDGHGIAGVERYFDARLREGGAPLRLSLDVRVQAVVRDELLHAMEEFRAIGACGIVMDVRTGEVLAMVSLPDYDANDFGHTPPDDRFNRAVTGMYEPGSTFKLQTVSMALDDDVVHIWNGFDATYPIKVGRFTISDFEGKHRFLYIPEIIAYSSNIGAAKMAQAVGAERQRDWMRKMGLMSRLKVELPEVGQPLFPPVANWKESATLTIGFGHGIAVSPLHVVMATAAVANGGVVRQPTLLANDEGIPPPGTRVMQESTSDTVRKLMRLVVTDGYGKQADVPGYFVGGKTGTAEKISHRAYNHNSRVSAFMSVFPMNAPRYAVYMMLDEPQADATTHGFATAGWVSAPAAGRVIARIGPMLGLLPDLAHAQEIQATLAIPLEPGRGSVAARLAPRATAGALPETRPAPVARAAPYAPAPIAPASPANLPLYPKARDMRHEAAYRPGAGGSGSGLASE